MKNTNNIFASILGVYFAMLPILLSVHSSLHSLETIQEKKVQYKVDTIVKNQDCYTCNFYFNQQLYCADIPIVFLPYISNYQSSSIKILLRTNSTTQLRLRGPPYTSFILDII